jgi:hypothetical protein
MREIIFIGLFFLIIMAIMEYCDSKRDPYEIGSHFDYSIVCEDGFKYKKIRGGIIPCKNSDGTFLKCNQKRY